MCVFFTGERRCLSCKSADNEICFHHALDTDNEIERKRQQCVAFEQRYAYFQYLLDDNAWKYFVMKNDPNIVNQKYSPTHIDYVPAGRAEKIDFSSIINNELMVRSMDRTGNLEIRRERLKKVLNDQDDYIYMKKAVVRYDRTRNVRLVKVEWCIPCAMHMHNRVTEKILFQLLKKAYSLRDTRSSKDNFIETINTTMNEIVLGSAHNRTRWSVPLTDNKNDISSNLSLSDGGAKKVMENIDVLLSDCFNSFDNNNPREWTELYTKYDEVILLFKYVNKLL